MNFHRFAEDVGDRPGPGYSLDRIDNEKGYEPNNVRWATAKEQSANRRTVTVLEMEKRRLQECIDRIIRELERRESNPHSLQGSLFDEITQHSLF
jgi:hypothetical protein